MKESTRPVGVEVTLLSPQHGKDNDHLELGIPKCYRSMLVDLELKEMMNFGNSLWALISILGHHLKDTEEATILLDGRVEYIEFHLRQPRGALKSLARIIGPQLMPSLPSNSTPIIDSSNS